MTRFSLVVSLRALAVASVMTVALADEAGAQFLLGSIQDARVLTPGQVEPAASVFVFPNISDGGFTITFTGGGVTAGVAPRTDLGISVAYRHSLGVSNTLVFLQPRISLIANRLAVAAPIGIDLGAKFEHSGNRYHRGDIDVWPMLIGSYPLSRYVDLNGSVRTHAGGRLGVALEGGPGVRTAGGLLTVRTTVGSAFFPGGNHLWSFSSSVGVRLGR